MTTVELLLLLLILVIAAVGALAITMLWRLHIREERHWPYIVDFILSREMFGGRERPMVQENLSSLQSSVASLSRLTESFESFMEGWRDPLPECSEKERIRRMEASTDKVLDIVSRSEDRLDE